MRRIKVRTVLKAIGGVLLTVGGWYLFLVTVALLPYPSYSLLTLVLVGAGFLAMISGQLGYGPLLLWEAWTEYREEGAT